MIATVFVGLVLALGIHVEAGPTPNLKDEIDTDIGCSENHQHTIVDCANSAIRTKYGNTEHIGTACEMVEIADECVESINGNCATDAGFSGALSQLQRECDQEKSGFCTENHQHMIIDCTNSAMTTKYGEHYYRSGKMCEMVEIADECVESINGNCATDARFSRGLSVLQHICDHWRSEPTQE